MIENTNNINDKIVDNSHCNFDSPEIYITSKGLLRKSNYSMNKKVEKIDIEKI